MSSDPVTRVPCRESDCAASTASRRDVLRWLFAAATAASGCHLPKREDPALTVSLPSRYSVLSEQLVIQSDFKLAHDHPLILDLLKLKQDVATTLRLDIDGPPVVIYLFSSEQSYSDYLVSTWPSLPYRRAYFFGNSHELAVYTFWGEKVQEDLRHEFTHGLLNSSLQNIPLWLDEGLAEYFEVPGRPGTVKPAVVQRLSQALTNGWQPDMKALESLTDVTLMTQANYEEAWAWMHLLLHSQSTQRDVLLDYLQSLQQPRFPGPLSTQLSSVGVDSQQRFLGHIAALSSFGAQTALVPN